MIVALALPSLTKLCSAIRTVGNALLNSNEGSEEVRAAELILRRFSQERARGIVVDPSAGMSYIFRRIPPLVAFPAAVIGLLSTAQCGSSTSPTNSGTAISAVALSAPSLPAGRSEEGAVTLSAAAPTGVTVTLASSNAAVATVPASVAIAAGSSTAGFTITAVAPGTAAITASMNGSSSQSRALTVTARVTLAAITVASPSVVGGESINGTVALSGSAPAAGAVVTLSAAIRSSCRQASWCRPARPMLRSPRSREESEARFRARSRAPTTEVQRRSWLRSRRPQRRSRSSASPARRKPKPAP